MLFRYSLLILLVLLGTRAAQAQAWTQPAGTLYAQLTAGSATASEQYAFDGETTLYVAGLDDDTFRDRSLYAYAELGLTDRLTLVATLPYKQVTVEDGAFRYRTRALGGAALGVRVALLPFLGRAEGPNALAANVQVVVPTGYTRNYAPSVGAGQVDVQVGLGAGRSFYPLPLYAQASGSYRLRSGSYAFSQTVACQEGRDLDCVRATEPDFGNELVYSAEVGATLLDDWVLAQGLLNGVWSVAEPQVGFTALNPQPTRQRYLKAGAGLTVYPLRQVEGFEQFGVSFQAYVTPAGRNTIRSRDLFVGLSYTRPLF